MRRITILLLLFIILFFLAIIRLVDLQIFHHSFYRQRSLEQRTRIISLNYNRGNIFDRNGEILATSLDTYSVFSQSNGFSWVARKLPQWQAEMIRRKNPRELFLLKEKKRIYPLGKFAAQVLGFVGVDNQGLAGVELSCDQYLRGKEGKVITEGDPEGRELYGALRILEPGEDGKNVYLTIDSNIQYLAEKELEKQIRQYSAQSGMLIIMRAKTGEILALASKPDFDPNFYSKFNPRLWHPRFLDPYEPGSTFKTITTAAALEEKVVTWDSKLKALDQIEVGGKIIKNSHPIRWPGPEITISRMLEESINTGAVQLGLKLGPKRFYDRIRRFGFGEATGCGLEGESRGIVRHYQKWYKSDVATITFGQGIAVTPFQLLSAMSAFANGGKIIKPYLIKKIESDDESFVRTFDREERGEAVSQATVNQIKELLRNVVLYGSGRKAKMAYYSVGGKTGTAQKAAVGGKGYLKGRYIASFIGLVPLSEPELIALVIIDDPKGVIWGETVCGPVFKEVVEKTLHYLNVKPDML